MKVRVREDPIRAQALRASAQATLRKLEQSERHAFPSDTLVDYYSIIHKLFEAFAHEHGTRFRGEGAHYELIEFIADTHSFSLEERRFLQELREQRNRIAYEGEAVSAAFITQNEKRILALLRKVKTISA